MYQANIRIHDCQHKFMQKGSINPVLVLILFLISLLPACAPNPDPVVEFVEVNGVVVSKVKLELVEDESEVRFTDWFENIRMLELESTESSMIQYTMRVYVGEKYIITSTMKNGILMFSPEGKFIRAIAPHGSGPGEVADPNREIYVDEVHDKLYATDGQLHRDKLLCVHITTGRVSYIPFKNTGGESHIRDIIVVDDSLLYCTTMQYVGGISTHPVFCQTTQGELLWEIQKTHPLGLTNAMIRQVNDKIYFNYLFAADTTYILTDGKLIPDFIVHSDKACAFLEQEIGNISVGVLPINDQLYQVGYGYIVDITKDEASGYEYPEMSEWKNVVYNKKTGRASNIGAIENDFLGFNGEFYPQFHKNGIGLVSYEAVDLLHHADSVYHLPDISKELKSRLGKILETLDENDNPWLLVGDLKKNR